MIKFRSTLLVAVAAGTVALASCSASATDFQKAAEKLIAGKDGLGTGSKATCEKPADHNTGTTFTCVGTDANGNTVNFVATITSKSKFTVAPVTDTGTPTTDGTSGSTVDTTGASTVATDAPTASTTG